MKQVSIAEPLPEVIVPGTRVPYEFVVTNAGVPISVTSAWTTPPSDR